MTNSNNQFDLIENRLDRVEAIAESNARSIAANSASIEALSEATGRTLSVVERLVEAVEEDRINLQEYREQNDANVASLNAAVERLEAIIARLVGGQG